MVGEFATGLFGDLLNTGLKRGVSVAFQKLARLERVDMASRGALTKNPLVVAALNDFEIVVGSYQGIFTTTLDAFLKELSQTGILNSMVENALISRASPQTEVLFKSLHIKHFGDEIDSAELYSKMMNAFSTTLKELSKDTVLFSLIQASSKDLAARLDRIDSALNATAPAALLGTQSAEKSNEHASKIAKGLQQSYRSIRIETNRGPREVEINRIYVPPKLSFRRTKNSPRSLDKLYRSMRVHARETSVPRVAIHVDSTTLNYTELTESFRRVVILGDPGGGKSTICQKFCFDMAKHTSLQLQFSDKRLVNKSYKLPIRVILRKFEQARSKTPQLDLLTFIVRDVIDIVGGDFADIKGAILELLVSGRAALAFDGLDEILDTSMRQDYVDLVVAFCNQYPLCPVLVTSRHVGYDDAPLTSEFEEITLEKFDDQEVGAYVEKFMRVVGGKSVSEAKVSTTEFLVQTAETANDLRRNPLMLGLMGWLFLASGDVPSNRPEIYKECSVLMFERWDQRRGIHADSTSDFDRSQLFTNLASEIYGRPEYAGGVSKEWLQNTLTNHFNILYENKAKGTKAAREFVKFVTGRAWVMSEVGDNVYSFTHQTFLEYFFARFLDDKYDTTQSLLGFLKKRILKQEWNEVAHLALQLKTHRSLRKQEEAISILGKFIRDSRILKQQSAAFKFSARALEYINPSENVLSAFLDEFVPLSLLKSTERGSSSIAFPAICAFSSRERRDFVRDKITNILTRAVISNEGDIPSAAIHLVNATYSNLPYHNDAITHALPKSISDKVIENLRAAIADRAGSERYYNALMWQWYGEMTPERLLRFGLSAIINNPHRGSITELNGLVSLAVTSIGRYGEPEKNSVVSPDAAKLYLEEIIRNIAALLPLNDDFQRRRYSDGPPYEVWQEIYAGLTNRPLALAGAVLAHRYSVELIGQHRTRRVSSGYINTTYKKDIKFLEAALDSDATTLDLLKTILSDFHNEGKREA